jgi:hypothetical protein
MNGFSWARRRDRRDWHGAFPSVASARRVELRSAVSFVDSGGASSIDETLGPPHPSRSVASPSPGGIVRRCEFDAGGERIHTGHAHPIEAQ